MALLRRQQQVVIISNNKSNLQLQLDDLYTVKAKGVFIRSRARWIENGENNSSYFFNLEKHRQAKKAINTIYVMLMMV